MWCRTDELVDPLVPVFKRLLTYSDILLVQLAPAASPALLTALYSR